MNEADTAGPVELSVVIPVYGARECLPELHRRLVLALEPLAPSFEILLVNDASPDGAWRVIEELAARDPRVRGFDLSRNFGQHRAIAAGLDHVRGRHAAVMDCDLQHPPEELGKLYRKALEGHDIVIGRRAGRTDGALRHLAARAFAWLLEQMTGIPGDPALSNFSVISRPVVHALQSMREQNRSYPLMLGWLGFNAVKVDFEHAPRFAGRTSYTFPRLVRFAVESLVSQSDKPLRLFIRFGFAVAAGALLYGAWLVFRHLHRGVSVPGWMRVIVSIYLIGGLLFVNLGLLGLYVGRLFEQAKGRPLYVVRRTANVPPPEERNAP